MCPLQRDVQPIVADPVSERNCWLHIWYRVANFQMSSGVPDSISREIAIDAPPETVWPLVTEPAHLAEWFSDEVEMDLRPGGAMVLTWHGHGTFQARIETVEPPRTFAFRWVRREGADPVEGHSTLVVMRLVPNGDRTVLQVTESGFAHLIWPEEETRSYTAENEKGWIVELAELRAYSERMTRRP
jgi:uncharacterized protein YndB with AHSA1/START domain